MRRPIIFLGPSMDGNDAKKLLDAEFRPPAKKGDFLKLISQIGNESCTVGLVDGVFLQDYPPSPIEVFQLLTRPNVKLFGAASLGALRAVELQKYGMIGIGKIFELFNNQKLISDDEVAVTFDQQYNKLQSEAMIDIRFNLYIALKKQIISSPTRRALALTAKQLYFPFRNYDDIITLTAREYTELDDLENFRKFIKDSKKSLKQIDTIKLLNHIKNSQQK